MIDVGIVVIGRNEGERLRSCLASVIGRAGTVVYVDSGSTDESVVTAQELGAEVVSLDMNVPFTAARARNAGLNRLLAVDPGTEFVQFVDGDCEIVTGWLGCARRAFDHHGAPGLVAVCGRLRERFPARSLYNRLADIEWNAPIGEVIKCGGLAMFRVDALQGAGGFREELIAGEEGELCLRLRRRGGRIVRLGDDMGLHDMAMTRFSQWWRRATRTGHAYTEGFLLHGQGPERYCRRETFSLAFWGLLFPLGVVWLAEPTRGASLLLLAAYPLWIFRTARGLARRGLSRSDSRVYAFFCIVAKFAQSRGMIQYALGRLRGRQSRLIEYKEAPASPWPSRASCLSPHCPG